MSFFSKIFNKKQTTPTQSDSSEEEIEPERIRRCKVKAPTKPERIRRCKVKAPSKQKPKRCKVKQKTPIKNVRCARKAPLIASRTDLNMECVSSECDDISDQSSVDLYMRKEDIVSDNSPPAGHDFYQLEQ
eukprot:TRINITY_DN7179_c0_g1_i1.p1 TRINITY_DN7179_c0_g1~~TRINITY_DN7179_c0_g1_i1.p1  ORF type:complete len:138 (-),score=27.67 TRINITY_DN7179_c0_g1_i1:103-495(-)